MTSTRVALVTGAAGAIGSAIAEKLHGNGLHIVAADLSGERLEALAERLPGIDTVATDLSTSAGVEAALDAAGGGVDVVCTAMGVADGGAAIDEVEDDLWNRVIQANLQSVYLVCQRAVPGMLRRGGGVIVNVASVAGLRGGRSGVAYTASKWAVVGLSQNIAASLGRDGIRSHAVCPSRIEGVITLGQGVERTTRGAVSRDRDTARPPAGTPRDVAEIAGFLVSDAASHLNGLAIPVDGGWLSY